MTTRSDALALDAADPLSALRHQFVLPEGIVYLDGNSLGALPRRTASRVSETIGTEWGEGLIRSWNSAGWIDLARVVGDRIAALVGAKAGEIAVGDSTSVNLFKVLSAAAALQKSDSPTRRVLLSERGNFPTDLYIADSVAAAAGSTLRLVDAGDLPEAIGTDVAVLMLTHVDYRSGRMHDMAALTRAAHEAGALVIWDLAHSAGAVPVELHGARADFAVGCGYKYLNGGPGAPAFVWAHPRHTARMDREGLRQPLSGWLGHAAPFEFSSTYRPSAGIQRFVCGTPPILAMQALACGLDVFADAEAAGGVTALRTKSTALTELFIERVDACCPAADVTVVTPRHADERGSQVSLSHGEGYAVMQALIERGVIGDFRAGDPTRGAPDLLRFGFTPLYTRFVDAWDAVDVLADVLRSEVWREPRFKHRAAVT